MIGRTLLHYTITSALGAGGMGRVYLARDTTTDRLVALKLLDERLTRDPEARERLIREARAAARLSHSGIVTLYAIEEAEGELFLIQQYVEGETLGQRFAQGLMSPPEVERLAREMVAALAHAHANGVLHRDLKPDNVLVAADGSYRIADFGIAHVQGAGSLTTAGTVMGSMPYLAPERLRGNAGDGRADLFSLGAILYEAIAGRRPFSGATEEAVMYAVLNEEPPPLEPASSRLQPLADLALHLLDKEPSQRPASAAVVLGMLEGMRTPTTARGATPVRPAWLAPATIAAFLILAAVGLWLWRARLPGIAEADEPAIAVLYFENVADPEDEERMGPVTGNLLVTSLAQTPRLNVLGTQRILDAMRELGQTNRVVDRSVALQVARRARASRIITGSILQTQPHLVLTVEVAEVKSGKVLDAARIEGQPGQTVFQVVDALSARLMRSMALASEANKLQPLTERSSADLVAQRSYLEGLEHLSGGDIEAAIAAFRAALRRDPDFAQALYHLALSEWWNAEPLAARASVEQAERVARRLSPFERRVVEGLGRLAVRDWSGARIVFSNLAREHPDDKLAQYGLVEACFHSGDIEGAATAARRALAIDPGFTLAGVHLVDALAAARKFDQADSTAAALLARSPRNFPLWNARILLAVTRGDLDAIVRSATQARAAGAGSLVEKRVALLKVNQDSVAAARTWLTEDMGYAPFTRDNGYTIDYWAALRAGRFREAAAIAERAWKSLPPSGQPVGPAIPGGNGFQAWVARRDTAHALVMADSIAARLVRWQGPRLGAVWSGTTRVPVLIALGRLDEAERLLAQIERLPESRDLESGLEAARSAVLMAQGRHREALEQARVAPTWPGPPAQKQGFQRVFLARAHMALGEYDQALPRIDTLLRVLDVTPDEAVRLHLHRGLCLEKLGHADQAAASYRALLHLWKNADPGTPEVGEARAALARIEQGSSAAAGEPGTSRAASKPASGR